LNNQRPDLETAVVLDHEGHVRGYQDIRRLGERFNILDTLVPRATLVGLEPGEKILASERMFAAQVPARHISGQIVGSVLVGQKRDHLERMLTAGRGQVSLMAAAMALFGVLLALLIVRRLLAPLDVIRAGLVRIGLGDLDKPIDLRDRTELGLLAGTIDNMAEQLKLVQAENHSRELEIIDTQRELIHTLGEVVEVRSHETGTHIDRVADGAAKLASLAGLSPEESELLRLAAPMHDIGKIGIPDAILNKPGKFTEEEFALMQTHTTLGHQILSQSKRPILKTAALVAHQHHERWDGRGYPQGLAGEDIHVYGRIVSIVDVFDALTSDRCYRAGMQLAEALAIMTEGRGSQFDPDLLDLFLANLNCFHAAKVVDPGQSIPVVNGEDRTSAEVDQTEQQERELQPIG
jgi:HD-GYP domain-containing protein (c-di-GMP phosphodiesterase class II)